MNSPAARDWGLNWSRWSTPWLFPADRDWKPPCVFLHQDKATTLNVGGVDFALLDKDALSCFEETMRTFGTSDEVMWPCHKPVIAMDQRTLYSDCVFTMFIILYICYRLSALSATCVSAEFAQFTESTSNCLHLMHTTTCFRSGNATVGLFEPLRTVMLTKVNLTLHKWQKEGKHN